MRNSVVLPSHENPMTHLTPLSAVRCQQAPSKLTDEFHLIVFCIKLCLTHILPSLWRCYHLLSVLHIKPLHFGHHHTSTQHELANTTIYQLDPLQSTIGKFEALQTSWSDVAINLATRLKSLSNDIFTYCVMNFS